MKAFLLATLCLALCAPVIAQNADEPASRDDVILYLRTMRSHDMVRRTLEVQVQAMQQLLRDQMLKEKGSVPQEFDTRFKKIMDDLVKTMPLDEMIEATIPAYQKHFAKGEIEAMNTFYSSPVGQKVLHELPEVMQEANESMMPLLSNFLTEWKGRIDKEFKDMEAAPASSKDGAAASKKN